MQNPKQICISEICSVKQNNSREMCESSYMLESNFTEARLGVEVLDSDYSMLIVKLRCIYPHHFFAKRD